MCNALIICLVQNLIRHVLCLSLIMGFPKNQFDSALFTFMFQAICVIGVFSLLYLLGCVYFFIFFIILEDVFLEGSDEAFVWSFLH